MKDKSVLITGSNKGLGEALALVFAENGYGVILHGRNRNDLARVKNKVIKKKVRCYDVKGDLKSAKTINSLNRIARQENISVLLNNAALQCPHLPLEKITEEKLNDILVTNLIAPIKLTKKIYKLFSDRGGGTIININSLSGIKNQELRSIYCASKWGLRGFTETLKLEAKKNNIRIIDVYPDRIKTRPDFTYGMDAGSVAQKIFKTYKNTKKDRIILTKGKK